MTVFRYAITMHNIELPSSLFPFRLEQLECFAYGSYRLRNVFGKINEQQQQACIELWLKNHVLPNRQAAVERSKEVCYLIEDTRNEQVIGVNTLYPGHLDKGHTKVWLNRMFLDPQHRATRLMIIGTALMLCYAKTNLTDQGMVGVVNVNENRKLSRPGMQRIFQRLGYKHLGWQQNKEVILFEFAKVHIISRA